MSAFEPVGVVYLAGSRKSLKIKIGKERYFVLVRDIRRALSNPRFHAEIYQAVRTLPDQLSRT